MFTFINKLRKPRVTATLVKGTQVKVKLINANDVDLQVILYSTIRQVARAAGIEPRTLFNKLTDLDRTVVRSAKKAERQVKYGKK